MARMAPPYHRESRRVAANACCSKGSGLIAPAVTVPLKGERSVGAGQEPPLAIPRSKDGRPRRRRRSTQPKAEHPDPDR
jgi:hypothetical protein